MWFGRVWFGRVRYRVGLEPHPHVADAIVSRALFATPTPASFPPPQNVFPYCTSIRDCYEKAISCICRRQPRQPLVEAVAELSTNHCADPARPFPCRDGCEPSYVNCSRPRTHGFVTPVRAPRESDE